MKRVTDDFDEDDIEFATEREMLDAMTEAISNSENYRFNFEWSYENSNGDHVRISFTYSIRFDIPFVHSSTSFRIR